MLQSGKFSMFSLLYSPLLSTGQEIARSPLSTSYDGRSDWLGLM